MTRPHPYIPAGDDGWTRDVNVPGFGRWSRTNRVGEHAVYNQGGRDYHVTINHTFIVDPSHPDPEAELGIHVSSNDGVVGGGGKVRWPLWGGLNAAQRAWLDGRNTDNHFDRLIAAFTEQIRLSARSVALSRAYDQEAAEARERRHKELAERYTARADYQGAVAAWVAAVPSDAYREAFQVGDGWYYSDPDRREVVRLEPKPLRVKEGDGPSAGFVNLCRGITGEAETLTEQHWVQLSDNLTMVRLAVRSGPVALAMRTSEFGACPTAGNLLSLDQVVEQAVDAWVRDAAAAPPYAKVSSGGEFMNLNGPDRRPFHLRLDQLHGTAQFTRLGTDRARTPAATLGHVDGRPGVYAASAAPTLQAALPPAVRISDEGRDVYALKADVVEGWSKLPGVGSVDAETLAHGLVSGGSGCEVFAENLLVDGKDGMTVYLWDGDHAFYVGLMRDIAPGAKVSDRKFDLKGHAKALRDGLSGSLFNAADVATGRPAGVIRGDDGWALKPPIFLDKGKLKAFDLAKAQADFETKQRAREAEEKGKAAKAQSAAAAAGQESARVWSDVIGPQVAKGSATLALYDVNGALVAVGPGSAPPAGARLIDRLTIVREDKKTKRGTARYLSIMCGNSGSHGWAEQMAVYIRNNKPDLPAGFMYVVSRK